MGLRGPRWQFATQEHGQASIVIRNAGHLGQPAPLMRGGVWSGAWRRRTKTRICNRHPDFWMKRTYLWPRLERALFAGEKDEEVDSAWLYLDVLVRGQRTPSSEKTENGMRGKRKRWKRRNEDGTRKLKRPTAKFIAHSACEGMITARRPGNLC